MNLQEQFEKETGKESFGTEFTVSSPYPTHEYVDWLENKLQEQREKHDELIYFCSSLEEKAYDAWKPMQAFRSDRQVEDDDIRKEVLDGLWDEVKPILTSLKQD